MSGSTLPITDPPLPLAAGEFLWNPFNKVCQDHRDGTVDQRLTDFERARRGLPIPWTPALALEELKQGPVY